MARNRRRKMGGGRTWQRRTISFQIGSWALAAVISGGYFPGASMLSEDFKSVHFGLESSDWKYPKVCCICFFLVCICIWICYVRGNNWWVISKMLNLTLIKRLSSLEETIMALCFGGLDLTSLNYPWLSAPADSLMCPIRGRQDSYHKCRHGASGVIRSLDGLILQIEPSSIIATVTALFRTRNESFFQSGSQIHSLWFKMEAALLAATCPRWTINPTTGSLGSASPHPPFLFSITFLQSFVFDYFLSSSPSINSLFYFSGLLGI